MIIFTENPQLANCIATNAPTSVLNLSSLYSGYIDITGMISKLQYINNTEMYMPDFVQSPAFDMQFANFVLNDPEMFCKLMGIMMRCKEGYNVVILVQHDVYRDAVMESLIKLIQQRYGYLCWIVEDMDDIECIRESWFTPEGLLTLDQDIFRYDQMGNKEPILPNINQE